MYRHCLQSFSFPSSMPTLQMLSAVPSILSAKYLRTASSFDIGIKRIPALNENKETFLSCLLFLSFLFFDQLFLSFLTPPLLTLTLYPALCYYLFLSPSFIQMSKSLQLSFRYLFDLFDGLNCLS